jgi:membrane protease YdiL (CAAX protease family)
VAANALARPAAWAAPLSLAAVTFAGWEFTRTAPRTWRRRLAATALLVLASALMVHVIPGFANPRVIADRRFTPDAVPYSVYLNFDKTFAGIVLLGWCHDRISRARDWRTMFATAAPWTAALLVVMLLLARWSGYVRFEPKFPAESWLWIWINLCFTCVAEEALFRGFIQRGLQRAWSGLSGGKWLALVVAALLFGIAHSAGGPAYVGLSTVAGVGYGWVYQRTGRIEASILTHFLLNAAHFLFFTYPALAR